MPTRALVGGRHRYVHSSKTDVSKTFEKFARAQRIEQLRQQRIGGQQ